MKTFFVLSIIGLSFIILPQAAAQRPGGLGTVECRDAQLQIQETVEMKGPYRNHGKLVRTAVRAVISSKRARKISWRCAGCIFKEFVLRIPIEEQEACGPDIEPEACFLADDSCEDMRADDCIEAGGIPEGEGTDCISLTQSLIETEACCFPDESCADMPWEDCEAIRGAMPQGPGSECTTDTCARP
jgi:hypothetical protein